MFDAIVDSVRDRFRGALSSVSGSDDQVVSASSRRRKTDSLEAVRSYSSSSGPRTPLHCNAASQTDAPKQPSDADLKLKHIEAVLKREQRYHNRQRSRADELERQLAKANERIKDADMEFKGVSTYCDELQETLRNTQQQLSTKARDCEDYENELNILRGVLSTYDDASAEDVGNVLQDINDRIEEVARDTSHKWLYDSLPEPTASRRALSADTLAYLNQHLGSPFVDLLERIEVQHETALFLVQAAWQAVLLERVAFILNEFSLALAGSDTSAILQAAAHQMHTEESQPVYGKWRAMTHKYTNRACRFDVDSIIKFHTSFATGKCYRVAVLLFKSRSPTASQIETSFDEQVAEILTMAVKLSGMLKEKIVTADYVIYSPSATHDNVFDPAMMDVTDPDSIPPAGTPVMCTVRLGLAMSSKAGREREAPLQKILFRKPQVVTLFCLQDAQNCQ